MLWSNKTYDLPENPAGQSHARYPKAGPAVEPGYRLKRLRSGHAPVSMDRSQPLNPWEQRREYAPTIEKSGHICYDWAVCSESAG